MEKSGFYKIINNISALKRMHPDFLALVEVDTGF
jgi:hypothetical protein